MFRSPGWPKSPFIPSKQHLKKWQQVLTLVCLNHLVQVARASPLAGFAQCSRAGLPGTRSTAFCSAVHARGAIMGHALLTRGIARKRVTALRMAQDDDDQENEGAHAEERAIALSNEDSAESKKVKELMARISSTSDAPAPTRLFKALRKPSGAPSLIAEISLDPSYPPSDTGQALSEACRFPSRPFLPRRTCLICTHLSACPPPP